MSRHRVGLGLQDGKAHRQKNHQDDNSRPRQSILHQGGRLFRGRAGLGLGRAEEESVSVCQIVSGKQIDISY